MNTLLARSSNLTRVVLPSAALCALVFAFACSSSSGGRRGGAGGTGNTAACPQLAGTWEVDGEGTNACPVTTTCTVTQTGCTFQMSCTDGTNFSGTANNASATFSNAARNCSGPLSDLDDEDADGEIDPDIEGSCRVMNTTCDFKAECESGSCRTPRGGSGSPSGEGGSSSGGASNGGSGSSDGAGANANGGADNGATCRYENDGECDDPTGIGVCPAGTDLADCAGNSGTGGSSGGGTTCPYENDGECDDSTGTNVCPNGTDLADCSNSGGGESSGSSCNVSDCHNETLCDEFGCIVCSYYCSGDSCISGGCN